MSLVLISGWNIYFETIHYEIRLFINSLCYCHDLVNSLSVIFLICFSKLVGMFQHVIVCYAIIILKLFLPFDFVNLFNL